MTIDGWRGQDGEPADGTREGDYLGDGNLPWPVGVDPAKQRQRPADLQESIPDQLDRAWDAMADAEPADLVQFLEVLANAKKACEDIRKQVEARLAAVLGAGSHLVDCAEVRVSKGSASYTCWDTEAVYRDVMDTKRADANGEPIEETPLDKVRHVWSLGAPRRDALRERGLDPEDYCTVKRAPKVSVIR